MRSVQLSAINQLAVVNVPDPIPAAGEVVVTLKAAALNHRDAWIKQGQYAGLKFPYIPGSDGAGVVTAAGPGTASAPASRASASDRACFGPTMPPWLLGRNENMVKTCFTSEHAGAPPRPPAPARHPAIVAATIGDARAGSQRPHLLVLAIERLLFATRRIAFGQRL